MTMSSFAISGECGVSDLAKMIDPPNDIFSRKPSRMPLVRI